MIKKGAYIFFCFSFFLHPLFCQDKNPVFTQDQLLWFVEKYHPVSVQSKLLSSVGESNLRKARGGFDPYIYSQLDQKDFAGKNYFSVLQNGLKIPTWYGVELKTGFDQNRGVFLNPENNLPGEGLWYTGISVPLGQGLWIDKRRAALKQAGIFINSTLAEQKKLMNDLYFSAIKEYWKWVEAWNQYLIYEEAVGLAEVRFSAVKQSFLLGDNPAIDTLEAFIQLQNREISRDQFKLQYQNETLELSNYLWFEKNTPLQITDSIRPPVISEVVISSPISLDSLQQIIQTLENSHPVLQLYDNKLASMDVERLLKVEKLKPKINLNYNFLRNPSGESSQIYSTEDYKWGFSFSFPLFLREQRGDLQLTKLKIQNTGLERQQKVLELQNKVRSYYNELIILENQIATSGRTVRNYFRLLDGEKQKFSAGESSLFLVNSRETNLIKAQLKFVELVTKQQIAHKGTIWAAGVLF